MKQRIFIALTIILLFFVTLEMNINEVYASGEDTLFTFELINDETEIRITGHTNPTPLALVIPAEINGKPVTQIGDSAFRDNNLTSVSFPSTINSIGRSAFLDNNLTMIEIPNGLTSIADWVFARNQLTSLIIPDNITSIGYNAFSNNNISTLEISDSVTTIEGWAFSRNQLGSLNIPNSVTSIGDNAFRENNLTTIIIPDSISIIEGHTFRQNNLTSISLHDNLTSIGDSAFSGNELTSVDIPNSATSIGDSAFGYNKLISVDIPDSVINIKAYAFDGNQLTTVKIGSSVTDIGREAFRNNSLSSVDIPESVTSIGYWAFEGNQDNPSDFTIYGLDGSVAKSHAIEYGYTLIQKCKATFKDYDDTVLKEEIVIENNSAIAPDNPTREHHTFIGWDKPFDNITSNIDIIAQYDINQYTISFDSNGGSIVSSITSDYGSTISPPATPTKSSYEFEGWYKEEELINQWNFETDTVPAQNITLYANWYDREIITFEFAEQIGQTITNEDQATIDILVENRTDLTTLVASFSLSEGAIAKVNNVDQISGETSNDFSVPVTYEITSSYGTVKEWTINVTELLSDNTNLESLSVSLGEITPDFDNNTNEYFVDVASRTTKIDVTAVLEDENGNLELGIKKKYEPLSSNVAKTVVLNNPGTATSINIKVIAQDGTHKIYTLTVNREEFTPSYVAGEGTFESPYLISTLEQLNDVRFNLFAHYMLISDIDASDTINWDKGKGFEPIGYLGESPFGFEGVFDGNGYVISNLYINRPETRYIGLFNKISKNTSNTLIKSVNLQDVNITGHSYVGAIAGSNSNATITDVHVTGNVTGHIGVGRDESYMVGGIIGRNDGTINRSFANVSVTGQRNVGGLAGSNESPKTISDSYAIGDITGENNVGGLVGYNSRAINRSYATGQVTASGINIGSFIGQNDGAVTSCAYKADSNSELNGVGSGSNDNIIALTNEQMKDESSFIDWDFDEVWVMNEYPTLKQIASTYFVFYDKNGATSGNAPFDSTSYKENEVVTVAGNTGNLTKTDYTFMGWNTKADGTGVSYTQNTTFKMGTDNITLCAKWNKTSSIVTGIEITAPYKRSYFIGDRLNTNGMNVKKIYASGNKEALSEGDYTVTGFDSSKIEANQLITVSYLGFTDVFTVNINPAFVPPPILTYTVTFQTNSEIEEDSQIVQLGQLANEPNTPIREGYEFEGWFIDEAFNTPWDFAKDTVNGNTTLYAMWTEVEEYEVTFIVFEGKVIKTRYLKHSENIDYPEPGIVEGYIFSKWDKENIEITKDITINAIYQKIDYFVTFNTFGGTNIEPIGIAHGAYLNVNNPIKEGYEFRGWYEDASTQNPYNLDIEPVLENMILYAAWEFVEESFVNTEVITDNETKKVSALVKESDMDLVIDELMNKPDSSDNRNIITIDAFQNDTRDEVIYAEVNIPLNSLRKVDDITNVELRVNTQVASVTFDKKALDTIKNTNEESIRIDVSKVQTVSLDEETKKTVGQRPVFSFKVTSGENTVSDFEGGNAHVSVPYEIKPEEDKNSIIVYHLSNDGELIRINGKYDEKTKSVIFKTKHFSKFIISYNEVKFDDVEVDSWYFDAVSFNAAREIVKGIGNDMFAPLDYVRRADFLIMAMNAYGIEPIEGNENSFSDSGQKYYTDYVNTAKHLGFIFGTGDNRFKPEAYISRQDMLLILHRILDYTNELPSKEDKNLIESFDDYTDISDYAYTVVKFFIDSELIKGSYGRINPQDKLTRAEAVQVIYNLN